MLRNPTIATIVSASSFGSPFPRVCDQLHEVPAGAGLAQTLIGNNMGGHILRLLNGDLQAVGHKAIFAYVGGDVFGTAYLAELANTSLDEGELFGNQIRIRHHTSVRAWR